MKITFVIILFSICLYSCAYVVPYTIDTSNSNPNYFGLEVKNYPYIENIFKKLDSLKNNGLIINYDRFDSSDESKFNIEFSKIKEIKVSALIIPIIDEYKTNAQFKKVEVLFYAQKNNYIDTLIYFKEKKKLINHFRKEKFNGISWNYVYP